MPACLRVVFYSQTVSGSINYMHRLNPPLGMPGEPVTQDGNSVDRTTAVEMDLQLICSSSIVYLGFVEQCVRSGVRKIRAQCVGGKEKK